MIRNSFLKEIFQVSLFAACLAVAAARPRADSPPGYGPPPPAYAPAPKYAPAPYKEVKN